MDLTDENKEYIDGLTHYELLARWRSAPAGDKWFQGETGEYWGKRIAEMRSKNNAQAVADSKAIGW